MKTIKLKFSIILTSILILSSLHTKADERIETLDKTFKLNKTGKFSFSCYDTDLKINTWDKDEVRLTGKIIIQGGNEEDQNELIEAFRNPKVSSSENNLIIETDDMVFNTVVIGPYKRTTLKNGSVIKIDKYEVKYELWVPKSIEFGLKSKYNNINIAALTGKIDFELYDVDLTMLSFGNDADIKMKYSSAAIGNGGDADIDIYDCEFEIKEIGNVEMESKYSDIEIESVKTLDFNSYDDDIKIGNIQSLKSEAKYSEYRIEGDMNNCVVNFYDSDLYAKNIAQLIYAAKYSSLKAYDVKSAKIGILYDSNIKLGKVGEFICTESKYDEIEMDAISTSMHFNDAYSLDLKVHNAESSLKEFQGNFKYGNVNVRLANNLEFSMDFNITYGDVDFPRDRIKVKDLYIKESSRQSFEGETSENAACKIKFKGYDVNFDFD